MTRWVVSLGYYASLLVALLVERVVNCHNVCDPSSKYRILIIIDDENGQQTTDEVGLEIALMSKWLNEHFFIGKSANRVVFLNRFEDQLKTTIENSAAEQKEATTAGTEKPYTRVESDYGDLKNVHCEDMICVNKKLNDLANIKREHGRGSKPGDQWPRKFHDALERLVNTTQKYKKKNLDKDFRRRIVLGITYGIVPPPDTKKDIVQSIKDLQLQFYVLHILKDPNDKIKMQQLLSYAVPKAIVAREYTLTHSETGPPVKFPQTLTQFFQDACQHMIDMHPCIFSRVESQCEYHNQPGEDCSRLNVYMIERKSGKDAAEQCPANGTLRCPEESCDDTCSNMFSDWSGCPETCGTGGVQSRYFKGQDKKDKFLCQRISDKKPCPFTMPPCPPGATGNPKVEGLIDPKKQGTMMNYFFTAFGLLATLLLVVSAGCYVLGRKRKEAELFNKGQRSPPSSQKSFKNLKDGADAQSKLSPSSMGLKVGVTGSSESLAAKKASCTSGIQKEAPKTPVKAQSSVLDPRAPVNLPVNVTPAPKNLPPPISIVPPPQPTFVKVAFLKTFEKTKVVRLS